MIFFIVKDTDSDHHLYLSHDKSWVSERKNGQIIEDYTKAKQAVKKFPGAELEVYQWLPLREAEPWLE